MPRRELRPDDEQRSYAAVFLFSVGFLLTTALWAYWDDNVARRPWKKYQAQFFALEEEQVREEIAAERRRLESDPEYQALRRQLADAREALASAETAERRAELELARQKARAVYDEQEFRLRLVKSELEEAWYQYEHARLSGHGSDEARRAIEALDRRKASIEAAVAEAQQELRRVERALEELERPVQDLREQLRRKEAELFRLQQKLRNLYIPYWRDNFGLHFLQIPRIRQVVLAEFDRNRFDQAVARVDRCHSCHIGIDRQGFEDAPQPLRTHPDRAALLGPHPVEKLGCTPCHAGQGPAVNSPEQAHGEVRFWEHPLRRGEMVQASCISCHADVRRPHAERIARGEELFVRLGCHGCHLVEGYGNLDKVGPYLRRAAAKLRPEWLVSWIRNPSAFRPRTAMPDFFYDLREEHPELARRQSRDIAAYVLQASEEESRRWLSGHPPPEGIDPENPDLVARGRELVDALGCRGCHGISPDESPAFGAQGKDIAPNLSHVAQKTDTRWIYHWLLDPRGYSPVTRMPSLRLSEDEARAVASFLASLSSPAPPDPALRAELADPMAAARGEKLVRKYGCFGCHDIPGMEKESRIGVELTTFGDKPLEELYFGYRNDIPRTWRDWTVNKLRDPRTYATERIEQIMPQFGLAEDDIGALVVFLASRSDARIPERYRPENLDRERALVAGRRLVQKYNCVGCHVIEGEGGAIRARYRDAPTMAPPILEGEGQKVQPDWLFEFLKKPYPLRPWLAVRMPTFGLSDEEAQTLVDYFRALDRVEQTYVFFDPASVPPENLEAGRLLASRDYLSCFSCHQQGDRRPEGKPEDWAPDLALAKDRLNPDWILRWLENPQELQPGTKMPQFYDVTDPAPDGPEDILGGDDRKQIEALRDFIMTLEPVSSAASVQPGATLGGEEPS